VARAIQDGDALMSAINLGEVLYQLERDHGRRQAMRLVNKLRSVARVEDPDWDLICLAAHVKAAGRLSYADCFCVATALRHDAHLYTGDPEILAVGDIVDLVDLRA
jgi:predicted nucleic acid-binding protein